MDLCKNCSKWTEVANGFHQCKGSLCEREVKEDVLDKLASEMKKRDEDCANPPNAVDRGYHLAVQHMMEIIERLKEE